MIMNIFQVTERLANLLPKLMWREPFENFEHKPATKTSLPIRYMKGGLVNVTVENDITIVCKQDQKGYCILDTDVVQKPHIFQWKVKQLTPCSPV